MCSDIYLHLLDGILDELFSAHHEYLREREVFQPPLKVLGVLAQTDAGPLGVHKARTCIPIAEKQLL